MLVYAHAPDYYKLEGRGKDMKRYTWKEAEEYLKNKLGRQPSDKEIERYYYYMTGK